MKKLIIISFILMLTFAGMSQSIFPKGVKIGKVKTGTSVITVDSLRQFSTDQYQLYKGSTLLQPYIPAGFKVGTVATPSTLTATELGYSDGVTSPIQTQLDETVKVTDSVAGYTAVEVDSISVTLIESSNIKGLRLLGGNIAAFPLGTTGSFTSTATALTDNTGIVLAFYLPEATKVLGVKWIQGISGTSVFDNYNGFVLFSVSGGTYTQIDLTPNDGALWTSASYQMGTKAFTNQAVLPAGIYMLEIISNWGTANTVPTLYGYSGINSSANAMFTNSNKLNGTITGQTNPPASLTGGSLTNGNVYPAVWLYK